MKKLAPTFNRTIFSAYLVVAAIVLSAVLVRFDGLIQITLSIQGAQVTIDGRRVP